MARFFLLCLPLGPATQTSLGRHRRNPSADLDDVGRKSGTKIDTALVVISREDLDRPQRVDLASAVWAPPYLFLVAC